MAPTGEPTPQMPGRSVRRSLRTPPRDTSPLPSRHSESSRDRSRSRGEPPNPDGAALPGERRRERSGKPTVWPAALDSLRPCLPGERRDS